MIIAGDLEWANGKISVLGLGWDDGRKCAATFRTERTLGDYLETLHRADGVVFQNGIDADMRQMAREGIDVSRLEPKIIDVRLLMHAVNGHLAGTGSFDLRSMVLLMNGHRGERFPLDWKDYAHDILRTCAYDSAAAAWVYPTLQRQVTVGNLQPTVDIAHRCSMVFARMKDQGVRLSKSVLEAIYKARKAKTEEIIERYHLWEERGKKVIKRVPIWRSDKILDICEREFGIRPKDRQRKTWDKLARAGGLSPECQAFVEAIIDLGRGANDAHWLGDAEESDAGVDFSKVDGDGFIHPRYDICGSPDRAIAASPNVQNFPRPGEDPRPIPLRASVIPLDPSHVILEVDFSSVETITNAFESYDMDRVRDTLSGKITHEGTAKLAGDVIGAVLTRQQGKAVGHGMDKGESPYNLARTLFKTERPSRIQVGQCENIFRRLLESYPATNRFRDDLWERARDNPLVVTNSFGRRLMCFSRAKYGDASEFKAKHDARKKYWCPCSDCSPRRDRFKYAIAFLGRSCAFDVLLRKMAVIWEEKRLDQFSLPYLEVHDSLAFSVPREKAALYLGRVKECFSEPTHELNDLRLKCEGAVGESWAQCK